MLIVAEHWETLGVMAEGWEGGGGGGSMLARALFQLWVEKNILGVVMKEFAWAVVAMLCYPS